MKDQTTLAYINMFAVLGTLEVLCEIDDKAKQVLAAAKPVSVAFSVKDGPCAVLKFENGKCKMTRDSADGDIKLNLSSCEQFNRLIDGEKVTPIPSRGFTKLAFVLDTKEKKAPFTQLTDRLNELLRPTKEAMSDPAFKTESTILMSYLIAAAISEVGNHDFIGKFSARNTTDGDIAFEIKDGPALTVSVKNHTLTTVKKKCENPTALLEFGSMEIARNVFDNVENSMTCVCEGKIIMTGMIGNIDNINRMLDRVSFYLA